ncbi:MAG: archaellin/type IV pilin N-terminal domain-containing protein [Thermoplasmata archaeon]|nr:archaellin/type IV pilin N-terminal domain-containing protein [Thermoplasmata archaeon]
MVTRGPARSDGPDEGISSEVAVTVLTLITVVLAVLVYVFAITFL